MFEGILSLLNRLPGGSGAVIKPAPPEPKVVYPDYIPPIETPQRTRDTCHPMTIEEYENYYDGVRIAQAAGRILTSLHDRTREDKRHREILEAIREKEYR
jgi:hypothetical protein